MKIKTTNWNKWFIDYYNSLSFWGKLQYKWIYFWDNLFDNIYIFFWDIETKYFPCKDKDTEIPENSCSYSDPDKCIGLDGDDPFGEGK
jgi:hypothetical protein